MSSDWQISNDDLLGDEDFAFAASGFEERDAPKDFYYQVQLVGDRIFDIHLKRGVRGTFVFSFEANSDGELSGATVAVTCTTGISVYLMQYLDLKNLTEDREATGWDQAAAIRDTLMTAYAQLRGIARDKELI